jgi:hypothetical protein
MDGGHAGQADEFGAAAPNELTAASDYSKKIN